VCFVAPIISGALAAKCANFKNSTHTHDPALSHFPPHRYFQKSGTVPEFRINKPRLGNTLPVATLRLTNHVCRFTKNISLVCHGNSHAKTTDRHYKLEHENKLHFFIYVHSDPIFGSFLSV
jgi:hypothetical protein